ncbi:MAG: hypothetical protein ABJA10_05265 [Aestuariivirga sp.]
MFSLFKKSKNVISSQLNPFDRMMFDLYSQTQTQVQQIFAGRKGFIMLSGALFALQQDMYSTANIDLRKTDDLFLEIAKDKLKPHVLGNFPERFGVVIDALRNINDLNLDFLNVTRPVDVDESGFEAMRMMSSFRSICARIWLISILSKTSDQASHKIGSAAILMLFSAVESNELVDDALLFSGTYFNSVKSDKFNLRHWPPMEM